MAFQLLEQFCHQHGIFTAGNAYSDLVVFLNHIVFVDSFGKPGKQDFVELFADALLNFPCPFIFLFSGLFLLHQVQQPSGIAAL